jgi:carbon monoxide dehydrogenase subunit G
MSLGSEGSRRGKCVEAVVGRKAAVHNPADLAGRPGKPDGRKDEAMELKGEYRIPASREHVWALLNDPETLRACIPGCESLERTGDNGFAARVTTKIGPVKATFTGEVAITDMVPPESYRISGEGKGGVAGFASGGANVRLAPDGDGTLLTYAADAKVGGKLAQLGGRLIDSTAKKLADQFFACFAQRAAGEGAPAGEAAMAAPAAAAAAALGEPDARDPAAQQAGAAFTPAPAGLTDASPYHSGEPGGPSDAYRGAAPIPPVAPVPPVPPVAPVPPPETAARVASVETVRDRSDSGEDAAGRGGILSDLADGPPIGAAAQVTTGVSEDRLEIEEALHLREPAELLPRTTPLGTPGGTTTPELGHMEDAHRPNPLERAEEQLEREAAGGALGGPMVWGLLALAALIVIWFVAG